MESVLMLSREVRKRISIRDVSALVKNNYSIIQFFLLYISGLVIGAAISNGFPFIRSALYNYYSLNDEFLNVFIKNFSVYLVFYLILFISGLSFIGSPFITAVPILAGVLYSSTAVSYKECLIPDGYLIFLLFKLPSAILFVNTIFILTEISRKMLCKTRSSAFTDSTVSREFKDYILYFLIILIFGLICAITDATMLSMVKTITK